MFVIVIYYKIIDIRLLMILGLFTGQARSFWTQPGLDLQHQVEDGGTRN